MIAACPKCQTRYRLRMEQLGERGVRLRCRRCEALFRVLPPGDSDAAPRPAAATPEMPQRAPEPQTPPQPERSEAAPVPTLPQDPPPVGESVPTASAAGSGLPAVLVAHRDAGFAKEIAAALSSDGQLAVAADDGAKALLQLHRAPPKAAILDAGLPGIGGHQICELLKRNEALREIPVVVLQRGDSALDPEGEGYGAELYLEPADGETTLEAMREPLAAWGLRTPSARPQPEPPSAPEAGPVAALAAGPAGAEGGEELELGEELARAERLARIAVSDIVLYNEEKFVAALQSEDPLQTMRDELNEGRALLRGRIAQEVFEQRDFVGDELLRVARERA